jgi:recombinational DNA repair protein (RecF pathway)
MAHGGDFFQCVNCGITAKLRDPSHGRKQRYCAACAAEINIRKTSDRAMLARQSDISES